MKTITAVGQLMCCMKTFSSTVIRFSCFFSQFVFFYFSIFLPWLRSLQKRYLAAGGTSEYESQEYKPCIKPFSRYNTTIILEETKSRNKFY